jgi:hypothetical protein
MERISELGTTLAVTIYRITLLRLLLTANVSISPILGTLMMEALLSFDTSVLITGTRHHIPEDDILHSHCRETLKSYIALTGWTL